MAGTEEYQRQIEAGKGIVKGVLCALADSPDEIRITEFQFVQTHSDFDDHEGQLSLYDPTAEKIVMKLKTPDLADAPATPTRRKQLEDHVRASVIAYSQKNRGLRAN